MRSLSIIESRATEIALSVGDADLLHRLGKTMVSSTLWWNSKASPEEEKSVVEVQALGESRYRVKVQNMVGVIGLGSIHLRILPKIPVRHFMHLIARGSLAFRAHDSHVAVGTDVSMLEVLARWFLNATEALLRQGLRSDYQSITDELSFVRGSVLAYETSMSLHQGRSIVTCVFDELSEDTSLNRVIRAACQKLATLSLLSDATRTQARRMAFRFNCSALQPSDLLAKPDRLARTYSQSWLLARLILQGLSLSLREGLIAGSSFLVRTPELIERGLRSIICDALPQVTVIKRRLLLTPRKLSVNPDLTFDKDRAVGDIKYRYFSSDWNRGDLYQTVSFAAAFRARHGAVVGFAESRAINLPPSVKFGDITVAAIAWDADADLDPGQSEALLANAVRAWWNSIGS